MKLTFYPAQAPNKTGVLVVPGGGYGYVSLDNEGLRPAEWLNERGFDAWVLEYTTAGDRPPPIYPAPMDEAREAVRRIRAEGRVARLGIWGWSAGGHLSAVTATDPAVDLDFAVLAYPVISMEPATTHAGSLHNLLGPEGAADDTLRGSMCAETRVTGRTPPVFLFHTANDGSVPVQNSLLFATAMAAHGRVFQLLVLPDGPHGIGLALDDPKLTWTGQLERWIKTFIVEEQ